MLIPLEVLMPAIFAFMILRPYPNRVPVWIWFALFAGWAIASAPVLLYGIATFSLTLLLYLIMLKRRPSVAGGQAS